MSALMMSQVRRAAFQTAQNRKMSLHSFLITLWLVAEPDFLFTVCLGLERSPVSSAGEHQTPLSFQFCFLQDRSAPQDTQVISYPARHWLATGGSSSSIGWLPKPLSTVVSDWTEKLEQVSVADVSLWTFWTHSCCLKQQNFIDTKEASQQQENWTNNLFKLMKLYWHHVETRRERSYWMLMSSHTSHQCVDS